MSPDSDSWGLDSNSGNDDLSQTQLCLLFVDLEMDLHTRYSRRDSDKRVGDLTTTLPLKTTELLLQDSVSHFSG